jgi:hypothetical protein
MKISRVISAGLSGLLGDNGHVSWTDDETGTYLSFTGICSRLTEEIGVKISRVISARLSGLGDKVTSAGLTTKRNISVLYVRRLCGETVVKISRDIIFRHYVALCANSERPREA